MTTRAYVDSVGVLGPGLANWREAAGALAGREPYRRGEVVVPTVELLPPAERRRTGLCVKVALSVGQQALAYAERAAADIPTVFTSSGADGDVIHQICSTLAGPDREVSPTQFHNSVHNAAGGYWCIATQCREASTSLCCHDASFAAGLLEAVTQSVSAARSVLLVAYDVPYPEPLQSVRPMAAIFGVALLLSAQRCAQSMASVELSLAGEPAPASEVDEPELDALRRGVPAARALPLLAALAAQRSAALVLDYVTRAGLRVTLTPCA